MVIGRYNSSTVSIPKKHEKLGVELQEKTMKNLQFQIKLEIPGSQNQYIYSGDKMRHEPVQSLQICLLPPIHVQRSTVW